MLQTTCITGLTLTVQSAADRLEPTFAQDSVRGSAFTDKKARRSRAGLRERSVAESVWREELSTDKGLQMGVLVMLSCLNPLLPGD
jgi:hypothetical protein